MNSKLRGLNRHRLAILNCYYGKEDSPEALFTDRHTDRKQTEILSVVVNE
jgi:hypothetical protein